MLIDKSYFIGDINVPNTSAVSVGERLDWFINKFEPQFLLQVLGYELDKAFAAGLAEDPVPQKWADLKDGVEYTGLDGRLRKWRGFIETVVEGEDGQKQSMIANYVYYFFMRGVVTQTTGIGETVTKAENADIVSPADKMCYAWNEMIRWVRELVYFLDSKVADYPEWEKQDRCLMGERFQMINSFGI